MRVIGRAAWVSAVAVAVLGSLTIAAAVAAFTQDTDTKAVPYNTTIDANANCGRKHVNFGGFKTNTKGSSLGSGPVVWPGAMAPKGSDTDKWSAVASNHVFTEGRVTSIAYCRGGNEPKVKRNTDVVLPSAANDELRRVSVSCPQGKRVIGGGWSAMSGDPLTQRRIGLMGLERTSNRTWRVSVYNETGSQQRVTAIAVCGNTRSPTVKTTTVNVSESDDATATAQCPQGKEVVFGGLRGEYHLLSGINAFVFKFYKAGDDEIKAYGAHNTVGPTFNNVSHLTAIAYCK